jgi:starvation-inducible outer membrane lipoprotein
MTEYMTLFWIFQRCNYVDEHRLKGNQFSQVDNNHIRTCDYTYIHIQVKLFSTWVLGTNFTEKTEW